MAGDWFPLGMLLELLTFWKEIRKTESPLNHFRRIDVLFSTLTAQRTYGIFIVMFELIKCVNDENLTFSYSERDNYTRCMIQVPHLRYLHESPIRIGNPSRAGLAWLARLGTEPSWARKILARQFVAYKSCFSRFLQAFLYATQATLNE